MGWCVSSTAEFTNRNGPRMKSQSWFSASSMFIMPFYEGLVAAAALISQASELSGEQKHAEEPSCFKKGRPRVHISEVRAFIGILSSKLRAAPLVRKIGLLAIEKLQEI